MNATFISRILRAVLPLLFAVFLIWLYSPALDSFFANDDWVILYHNAKIPPMQFWKYFSFHTVWFYRPLQSMEFGLTYHLAGFNHYAYNVQLLAMHLLVCLLGWCLVRKLFSVGFASAVIALYSITWIYAEILIWKANFNTLQNAIATLLAAWCFVNYLDKRTVKWWWLSLIAAIADCLTKESAVNLPLILGTVWITRYLQEKWELNKINLSDSERNLPIKLVKDLLPSCVVMIVFFVLHRAFFQNIETNYRPGYRFMPPLTSLAHWMHGTNHSIFGFVYDPVLLGQFPRIQNTLSYFLEMGWYIPPVLLVITLWKRSPPAIFGLLFALFIQFPTFALDSYHASRYYYLSAMGGSIFLISCFWPLLIKITQIHVALKSRIVAYSAAIILTWIAISNIVQFQTLIGNDHQASNIVLRAFEILKGQGRQLPPNSMVIFTHMPNSFIHEGMGATEMVRFATGREDLISVTNTEVLSSAEVARFKNPSNKYVFDVIAESPRMRLYSGDSLSTVPVQDATGKSLS